MMMMVHHDNRGRPEQRCDGGDGPTCTPPPPPPPAGSSSSSSHSTTTRALQPFQYLSNSTTTNTAALRSPGSDMATTTTALGFPFTNQQWKELERQAMIYKYMMASLPVPRDLLFPTTTNSSPSPILPMCTTSTSSSNVVGFNLRLSNSTDPEPGRCKRTDGKKWRCSRDVAPDQKYCERHMHRGRPRSRKHVEIHAATTAKRVRRENGTTVNNNNNSTNSRMMSPLPQSNPAQFFGSTLHQTPMKSWPFGDVSSVSSNRDARSVEWMMKSETAPISQWHDLMQSKTELSCSRIPYFDAANSSVFGQHSEEEESFLNLNSYTRFNSGDHHHQQQQHHESNDCNLFLSPDVVALELEETPRSFIDAWSSKNEVNGDNNNNSSVPSSGGQLSPSSLTLSMGGYNSISEEMGQTQMSLGCDNGSGNDGGGGIKPQLSTWLTPASWVSSPPGGPLAEVLKPTTSAASTTPSSPMTANGNHGEFSSSPLGTTNVSSPSGVLQKTFANSFSDSSGNSSPSLTSSKAKTAETVSLWLNQSKA